MLDLRDGARPIWPCAVGLLGVLWRLLAHPWGTLWRDWIFILAGYGIYTVLAGPSRAWPRVTATVMAFLLGLYVQGQVRQALSVLGFGP